MSVKTKYRLQDVLTGNLKNEERSAQKVVQMNHIQKNQANFENLGKTLKERKITFSQFSFQQSEMIDDRKLRPVLNGICGRLGSMSCAELLTKKQIQFYLKSAEMSNQKRILKRYAHWEWDQTEEKKELPKYNFAGKVESDFKQQVKAKDAERRLRRQILKKWADQLPDVSGLATFGKQFTMQSTPIAKSKFFLTSYVNKSSLVKGFIDELTDIHEDLKQDKKIENFEDYPLEVKVYHIEKRIRQQIYLIIQYISYNMQYNWTFRLGCFNMFAGILMGALGGHKKWEKDVQDNFSRAQLMNFVSNVGILVASQKSIYPAIAFQLGILLFSGSIYHRCFTGDKETTKSLPPIGGTLMMVGWLILLL